MNLGKLLGDLRTSEYLILKGNLRTFVVFEDSYEPWE